MNGPQHLKGFFRVLDRGAHKGGLSRAGGILCIARAGIPGGRDNSLVIFYLLVSYDNPVGKDASRRLVEPNASHFALGEYGGVKGCCVSLADVVDEGLPLFLEGFVRHCSAHSPGRVAADGRMERIQWLFSPPPGCLPSQGPYRYILWWGRARGIHAKDIGQRAYLRRPAVERRGLCPGIFPVFLKVRIVRQCFSLPGMAGPSYPYTRSAWYSPSPPF